MPRLTTSLLDPRIAAAMAHPTRMRAMTILFERTASPSQIAQEMGEPVNNVTYHIKRLRDLGCVELVSTRPAQGGRVVEHFYRAAVQLLFDEDAWKGLGTKEKNDVTTGILGMMSSDITTAMLRGTFQDPDDNHLSRSPMVLDLEGWEEVKAVLKEAMERLMTIQERAVERRGSESDGETFHTRVHLVHFRSPPPETTQ